MKKKDGEDKLECLFRLMKYDIPIKLNDTGKKDIHKMWERTNIEVWYVSSIYRDFRFNIVSENHLICTNLPLGYFNLEDNQP